MRIVLQRVKNGSVKIDGEIVGSIDHGVVLLIGVTHDDTEEDAVYLANKIAHLRIFGDDEGKMNHSLLDVQGEVLSVSQFTLYGNTQKGRRPNFMAAATPQQANVIYERFNDNLRESNLSVATGTFGAMMDVQLVNDGPVTLLLESAKKKEND